MTDNWGFYERRTESELLRVLVNAGYKSEAPLNGYDELLSITVNLYPIREKKHTKREFIKLLERFEARLEQWLSSLGAALYIGRINSMTRLEFYYYLGNGCVNEGMIREWMNNNWQFRTQYYIKPDPQWTFYNYMLPDQLEELFVHNAQMIYALIHKGDNINQPRNVYHWLFFQQDRDRQEMEYTLQNLGYRIEKDKKADPDTSYPYPLVISKYEDVRLDTVNDRVRELYRLISGHGGRYDGWGSIMKQSAGHRARQSLRRFVESVESSIKKLCFHRR
ncbi:DUF695 domain-containing protein [Paenibacillus oenotherae]|uniref:DUF695 domain-containing protein n=1 Tax=Paenibacillus oenotherae TaxID=1435645 RepID=A0ABS7D402_9BACL|nr:DUF695 domain-containing protein [Paenibacillus oenotherae]MBW7474600.1 DUF695 domain-containing protein [Paenibacillus oenotherae]